MAAMRRMWALVRKDLSATWQSRQARTAMVFLPVVMAVVTPGSMTLAVAAVPGDGSAFRGDAEMLLRGVGGGLDAYPSPRHAMLAGLIMAVMPSLFLMIPVMVGTVLGASAVVGEKERGTLETLLYAPISLEQLLWAKVVGAWLPSVGICLGSGVVMHLVAGTLAHVLMDAHPFPNATWTVLLLWTSPAMALVALSLMVLVGARAQSHQEAMQFASLVILPVMVLLVLQAAGAVVLGVAAQVLLGAVALGVAVVLLRVASHVLTAERLLQ